MVKEVPRGGRGRGRPGEEYKRWKKARRSLVKVAGRYALPTHSLCACKPPLALPAPSRQRPRRRPSGHWREVGVRELQATEEWAAGMPVRPERSAFQSWGSRVGTLSGLRLLGRRDGSSATARCSGGSRSQVKARSNVDRRRRRGSRNIEEAPSQLRSSNIADESQAEDERAEENEDGCEGEARASSSRSGESGCSEFPCSGPGGDAGPGGRCRRHTR
jgi:hypothetical protein